MASVGQGKAIRGSVSLRGPWADTMLRNVQALAERPAPSGRSRYPFWIAGRVALDLADGRVPDVHEPIRLYRPDAAMASFGELSARLGPYESIDGRTEFESLHPTVPGSSARHMLGALIPLDACALEIVTPRHRFVAPVFDPTRVVLAETLSIHRTLRDRARIQRSTDVMRRVWDRHRAELTDGLTGFHGLLERIARNGGADIAAGAASAITDTVDRLGAAGDRDLSLPLGLRSALRDAARLRTPERHLSIA